MSEGVGVRPSGVQASRVMRTLGDVGSTGELMHVCDVCVRVCDVCV